MVYYTVDFRTIGGNAKALLRYPTTHQILVAEEVSSKDRTIDYRYNLIFLKKAIVRPCRRYSLVFYLPTATSLAVTIVLPIDLYTRAAI